MPLARVPVVCFAQRMVQVVVRSGRSMALEDYVLTIALGGAFAIGLMFIVMRLSLIHI